jgi:hypothetical protein
MLGWLGRARLVCILLPGLAARTLTKHERVRNQKTPRELLKSVYYIGCLNLTRVSRPTALPTLRLALGLCLSLSTGGSRTHVHPSRLVTAPIADHLSGRPGQEESRHARCLQWQADGSVIACDCRVSCVHMRTATLHTLVVTTAFLTLDLSACCAPRSAARIRVEMTL